GRTVSPDAIHIGDGLTGGHLARTPLGEHARARYGAPYVTLHRADLHAGLLRAAPASERIRIETGTAIESFRQKDDGIHAVPETGDAIEADALIGSDGLWSRLRGQVSPAGAPVFSGRTAWR